MKIGDRINVQMEGFDVAEAVIEDIEDGHATIVIPATRIVVAVKQSLDIARQPERTNSDHVFVGLDTPDGPVDSPSSETVQYTNVPPREQVQGRPQASPAVDYIPDDGTPLSQKELDSSVLD